MHPLILHFPIVILLFAMIMEFFRFKPENAVNTFYTNLLQNLLLIGTLFAALTVIMGLFLSKDEEYAGDTLSWHKWTGVGVFFFASLVYWIRNNGWYKAPVAKVGALITLLAIVLTGHFGGALTHGEDFIFESILSSKTPSVVPVEKAIVFDDVIMPIFEQKCVSCHNPNKLKGELMLTDAKSLLKGGESGKLFVPGNPAISLLLERVHMPIEEKKHMPPSGKPQLTTQEIQILALWVKAEASFKQKVLDLPANDSLRVLSTARLKPSEIQDEIYDFDDIDEGAITKLNNDYRTISVVAKESPAVSVNIYNRSAYSMKQLDELDAIKKQIVSLNLNMLPVKDADLKTVSKFENLRKLNLNFTDITSDGLKELSLLKHLQSLTLSGTKVNFIGLKTHLPSFKTLKMISIWETALTVSEIDQLKKANKNLTIIAGFRDDGSNPIQLIPPQVTNNSMIFSKPVLVQLAHAVKGVDIRYTTDGTLPDSVHSQRFTGQTTLEKSTTIRAKAFKNGWLGSDEVVFDFFKNAYKPDSARLLLPLNRLYQAAGANTFFDEKLGTFNAKSPAWTNNWAGVTNNDLVLVSEFKTPILLSSVGLRIMEDVETRIFPPESIEVWGGADKTKMKLIAKFKPNIPSKMRTHLLTAVGGKFKPQTVSYLKIIAKPLQKIPEWHRSKGTTALLLVDEMFLN
ncbi:MAG: c-type cytochrome domain-containing protein [Runella sp.]|nr:c-type cytochrome domain-containing protein [Runella sp.]